MRRTIFEELLESCHGLDKNISVRTEKSSSTQGSIASPKGKCCPKMILPGEKLSSPSQRAFDEAYNSLHRHPPNDQYGIDRRLGKRVLSENHINTLSDMAEDVQDRLQLLDLSNTNHTFKPVHADQICV